MRKVAVPDEGAESLFGNLDENLKHLEGLFSVRIRTGGQELLVEGDTADVARAERVLDQMASLMRGGYRLAKGDVKTAAQLIAQDESVDLSDYFLRGAPPTCDLPPLKPPNSWSGSWAFSSRRRRSRHWKTAPKAGSPACSWPHSRCADTRISAVSSRPSPETTATSWTI
jgi:phosphate starvation-inducible PhoH-like protein